MKELKLFLLIFVILVSCNQYSTPIESFFVDLENNIEDKEKLQKFKDAPRSAVINYASNFDSVFYNIYNDSKYQLTIDSLLNDIEKSYDKTTAEQTLVIAFQNMLKGKKIDFDHIANEVNLYNQK